MMVIKGNGSIKFLTKEEADKMFLSYVNDFLTVSNFAEYLDLDLFSAKKFITKMRAYNA